MTRTDKGIMSGLVVGFLLILVGLAFVRCGFDNERPPPIITIEEIDDIERAGNDQNKAFDDEKIKRDCFSTNCHGGGSAPAILGIQEGFKTDQKIRSRVTSGSMPPNGGYSVEDTKRFIDYLNSN